MIQKLIVNLPHISEGPKLHCNCPYFSSAHVPWRGGWASVLNAYFPNTVRCFPKHFLPGNFFILFFHCSATQPAVTEREAPPGSARDLDVFNWMEKSDQSRAGDRICLTGTYFLLRSWGQAETESCDPLEHAAVLKIQLITW